MAKSLALDELAVEAQVRIRDTRRGLAPLFEASLATGDWRVMAETKALAETLRVAGVQAKRLAGLAAGITCPDGRVGLWHGRAA